jgi:hypothetical protein
VNVTFDVAGNLYPLPELQAITIAENLRIKAAQFENGEGVAGARAVADAIEDALTGSLTAPIPLEGEAAEAVFYDLNISLSTDDRENPRLPEAWQLYYAVRDLHQQELRPQAG